MFLNRLIGWNVTLCQ